MKNTEYKILRKKYTRPEVTKVVLDNTISMVMMSATSPNPPPRGTGQQGNSSPEPFASPFDKPFG